MTDMSATIPLDFKHGDGRHCYYNPESGWNWTHPNKKRGALRCRRTDHPSVAELEAQYNAEQTKRENEVSIGELRKIEDMDPTMIGTIDFPEKGIKWPVPKLVFDSIVEFISQVQRDAQTTTLQGAFQRVNQIHKPIEGEADCEECGVAYPCPTIIAVLGVTQQKEQDVSENQTETNDVFIESKEGNPVAEMRSEVPVEQKEDGDAGK